MRCDLKPIPRFETALVFLLLLCLCQAVSQADNRKTPEPLPRVAPVSPEQAAETFRVLDGFRMELLAAEPLVTDPVAMQYDENGLAYVVEMNDYPYTDPALDVAWKEQTSEAIGRIRVLEDTDGDGRFDASNVFAEGLSWPTGLAFWKGGVYVTATPDVWYFKDTNGDRKADVRRKVLTGFRKYNVQAVMNNLAWGLDHRLYAAGSSNGGEIQSLGTEAKPVPLRRNDFRIDPVTESFEVLSGGARFGNTFDDFGNRFICNIRNPVQHVVLQQRYLARNPHLPVRQAVHDAALAGDAIEVFRASPPEPWRVLNASRLASDTSRQSPRSEMAATGYVTSSSGITIYRGAAYPQQYAGNVFVCEVAGNLVMRYRLQADGPTFRAVRATEGKDFLTSTDNWCRPVNFVNAPDGTLHVLDMYRETIEHPWSIPDDIKARLDLESGRDRGRIYRLAPADYPTGHQWNRQARLASATTQDLVSELKNPNCWWRETAHRLIFERQDVAAVEPLGVLLHESDRPVARVHALWSLAGLDALSDENLARALSDSSPRVREQAVLIAEQRLSQSDALLDLILNLAEDEDSRVRFQVALSLGEYKGGRMEEVVDALADIAGQDGQNEWLRAALLSSLAGREPDLFDKLVRRHQREKTESESTLLSAAAEIVGARNQPAEIEQVLASLQGAAELTTEAQLSIVLSLGRGLSRAGQRLDRYAAEDTSLLAQLYAAALQSVANAEAALGDRVQYAKLLGHAKLETVEPLLTSLLAAQEPQQLQLASVVVLGSFADAHIPSLLVDAYPNLTPLVRAEIINVLLSRSSRITTLLGAIDEGIIKRSEISAAQRGLLLRNRNEEIRSHAEQIFAANAPSPRHEVLTEYQPALALAGEVSRGKKVFLRECTTCHRHGDQGHDVGINLATVKNRTSSEIMVHILDPNREVSPNYFEYILVTTDGRTRTGVIAAETAASITLKGAEGKQETILRENIEEITSSGVSMMPEGLEKKITIEEMADLLAFVVNINAE